MEIIENMRIVLTAAQGILAHGWIRAREFLTWGDVLNNDKLTFAYMRNTIGLSEFALHSLQPDLQAWIRQGRVTLDDCPSLKLWDAHPINDFRCDLADLVRMRWQAEQYKQMGVSYDNLLHLGLTAETMILFGFTLLNWIHLGFTRQHCERIPEAVLFRLFTMNKMQIMNCLA